MFDIIETMNDIVFEIDTVGILPVKKVRPLQIGSQKQNDTYTFDIKLSQLNQRQISDDHISP